MSESDPKRPGEDRRMDERHFACFPAHIQRPGGSTRMALIRDLSVSGALILTREKLDVGDEVVLNLYLTDDMDQVRRAPARVVRTEPREGDRAEVWHHSIAVCFAEPLTDCAAEIAEIERRQAELGVPRD
jgi:hypothetical protein